MSCNISLRVVNFTPEMLVNFDRNIHYCEICRMNIIQTRKNILILISTPDGRYIIRPHTM